jgi:hypothetical protein
VFERRKIVHALDRVAAAIGFYLVSSWLQIRRPGFDFRYYQNEKVVGLERGPLSLVNTTEELLDRKVAAPV